METSYEFATVTRISDKSRSCYLAAPPLLRSDENVEGGGIIDELPAQIGLLLWRSFRMVMRWASEPESRAEAFDASLKKQREAHA